MAEETGLDMGSLAEDLAIKDRREWAAITLRVPDTGNPEIDAMIRDARRADFAAAALTGRLASCGQAAMADVFGLADAMVGAWLKRREGGEDA